MPISGKVYSGVWVVAFMVVSLQSALAQWSTDPSVNNPVSTAPANDQFSPRLVSDGSGGAIIAWYDSRNEGSTYDIYAQRINATGNTVWGSNGIAVCTAVDNQWHHQIIGDGSGGAIIVWEDARGGGGIYDIYAQKINANGEFLWSVNGVAISTASNHQRRPQLCNDGSGGAIIVWQDGRGGTSNYDIYAQRIDTNGNIIWTGNGAAISNAVGQQVDPQLSNDGAGGAIITWSDLRSVDGDIYAQRINTSGVVQWAVDGVPISTATGFQEIPQIISDGNGGAIICWQDPRADGVTYDIYAQRISPAGVSQWMANGVALCAAVGDQLSPLITSDDAGGAIIAWSDYRSGTNYDIYAQRINANGDILWIADGVAICIAANPQSASKIVSDGSGGAIIVWGDRRMDASYGDIYIQRINSSGTVHWTLNGIPVSTAIYLQDAADIISDGAGGAILTWYDSRGDSITYDIYAQRVLSTGVLAGPPPAPTGLSATAISTTQIDIQWTDTSTTEDGFRIERSPDGSSFSEIATVGANVTAYNDTGLTASITYYYRVRAYNSFGNSSYTNVSSATTSPPAPTPPTAPSGLTVTVASSTQINLSWTDNSTDENGFKIERSADGSSFSQIATVGANLTTYSDNGLSVLTAYYYRVRAYNSAGDSGYTNTASATTPGPPPAPSNLTATAVSSSQIDLAWTDNSTTEGSFKIERSTDGTTFTQIATAAAGTTAYSDSGLTASTTYYYRVQASNNLGSSNYTNTANATTQGTGGGGGGGGCGSVGVDLMWPLGVLWLMRRRRLSTMNYSENRSAGQMYAFLRKYSWSFRRFSSRF